MGGIWRQARRETKAELRERPLKEADPKKLRVRRRRRRPHRKKAKSGRDAHAAREV